jgi:uncharacterized iron-regulated membrane protein
MLFRPNLKGRARDWNLHNIFGFWMALPLLCMVLTGTIMAYLWATALLYRAAGSPPPPVKPEAEPKQKKTLSPDEYSSLDPAILRAMAQDPHWNSLLMRMPAEKDTAIAFTVDEGEGGIPRQRAQLSIARKDARVIRWEPFSANPPGRQWRIDARFLHTGEIFGPIGQLVALLAALSLLLLVWTGFSLAIRRWLAWKTRKVSLAKQASHLRRLIPSHHRPVKVLTYFSRFTPATPTWGLDSQYVACGEAHTALSGQFHIFSGPGFR